MTTKYNDKAEFKEICHQLGIPVVTGTSFRMHPEEDTNATDMAVVINNILTTHETVIIRGTLGESGMSLYKTTGNDLRELYAKISATGEKMVIIEPFLPVICSPGDQWTIDRAGVIDHIGLTDQVCERGMVHIGTQYGPPISRRLYELISQTSLKIVQHMSEWGYCGVIGIDYIVTDENVYPVENNARFNGSSYPWLITDKIKKCLPSVDYWKFIKIKTQPCTFVELVHRLHDIIYDGRRVNSIFPYNCRLLSVTGAFSVLLLAEDLNHLTYLEALLGERGVRRGK
ncbi:ATP-binding protein [Desulforhopalus sp. 52FAK]